MGFFKKKIKEKEEEIKTIAHSISKISFPPPPKKACKMYFSCFQVPKSR